ncbi:MAG TPA: hypothetical protein VGC45_03660 [Gryllotalpicola sp.]
MTVAGTTGEEPPRFSAWFRRWWLALVGGVVALGGAVLWLTTRLPLGGATSFGWFAYAPLPRRTFTYDASTQQLAFGGDPLMSGLHAVAAVLFILGLLAVAATVGFRLGRARP